MKIYVEIVKNYMAYMNERLKSETSYIKSSFLKINSFINIISNVTENIDRLALYKEPFRLEDKILALIELLQPKKEQ